MCFDHMADQIVVLESLNFDLQKLAWRCREIAEQDLPVNIGRLSGMTSDCGALRILQVLCGSNRSAR